MRFSTILAALGVSSVIILSLSAHAGVVIKNGVVEITPDEPSTTQTSSPAAANPATSPSIHLIDTTIQDKLQPHRHTAQQYVRQHLPFLGQNPYLLLLGVDAQGVIQSVQLHLGKANFSKTELQAIEALTGQQLSPYPAELNKYFEIHGLHRILLFDGETVPWDKTATQTWWTQLTLAPAYQQWKEACQRYFAKHTGAKLFLDNRKLWEDAFYKQSTVMSFNLFVDDSNQILMVEVIIPTENMALNRLVVNELPGQQLHCPTINPPFQTHFGVFSDGGNLASPLIEKPVVLYENQPQWYRKWQQQNLNF